MSTQVDEWEAVHRVARSIRMVLTVGAAVFALAGLALLLIPSAFAGWLGLDATAAATLWSLRMLGAVLLPLAALMVMVRRLRDHHAVGAAAVMLTASVLLGILTIAMPGSWTFLRAALLGAALVFATAYAALLVLLRRGG